MRNATHVLGDTATATQQWPRGEVFLFIVDMAIDRTLVIIAGSKHCMLSAFFAIFILGRNNDDHDNDALA